MPKINDIVDENEIASLGASLRAIEQNSLKQGSKTATKRIWFQGEEPYFDVFLELHNNEIIWFQFTLRGKSLSWDIKKPGWQTGNTDELNINDVSFYAATKTIESDNKVDEEFIKLVKSILRTRAEETIFSKMLVLFH
ncbi:hypothetical protein FNW02_13750 [Komarekiella sp. 'clone 1']|uniref:Uncharacterized protein n=1 Tax=Komarekiella delphini-convector SJRDD-AB1 TaxID=2593771 RepID=A0AA40SX13_9NOST|nr:hypothetical protein [Komarekiella delphini-convector SJRDD-AB1]